MCGSVESESAFREEANGAGERTVVLCMRLGVMRYRNIIFQMRNAVAKLNDLLSFDEFYLPNKGVTILC